MPDDGKMPERYINQPQHQVLTVRDLKPEHGYGQIAFGYVAVDTNNVCWVFLDAVVAGEDFRKVLFIKIRRTTNGDYEIRLDDVPPTYKFEKTAPPDPEKWAVAKLTDSPGV